jgi:hypothetical protein
MTNRKKKRITQMMRRNRMMKNKRHRYLERLRNKARNETSMAKRSRRQLPLLKDMREEAEKRLGWRGKRVLHASGAVA